MQIHCPHCRNAIELVDERAPEVLCPACGSSFHLEQERTPTYVGEQRRVGKFQLRAGMHSGG